MEKFSTCRIGLNESNHLGGIVGKTDSIAAYGLAYAGKPLCTLSTHPGTNAA